MNTSIDFQAKNIQFLEFELNNQCQYTHLHTWCPRNRLGNHNEIVLKTEIIEKVIQYFKGYDFTGTIYFSIYNEPLLDDRLIDLIKYAKANLNCRVQMYTNGLLLTPEKNKELRDAGLDILRVSIYNDNYPRVENVVYSNRLQEAPNDMGYDDRIKIYDRELDCSAPCYMPIQYYCVNCYGEVMLCWDDWKNTMVFGDLNMDTVESTLINPIRLNKIEQLKLGQRYNVCAGCARPTELCISEYRERLKL